MQSNMRALQKIHPELELRHGMRSSTYEVESEHAIHCHITRAGHWIAIRRTSMHCNEDTLVARKSLRNAGRKQESIRYLVSLDGIKWRVREAHDVETKKKLISPFNRLCHQPSTRLPSQIYDLAAASPASPVRARFSFPLPRQILSMSTVIVNGMVPSPDTSKRVSCAGGSFGVGGRQEAEEAKKPLDASKSKSKNDCNAQERSSGTVSYAGGVATSVYLFLWKNVNGKVVRSGIQETQPKRRRPTQIPPPPRPRFHPSPPKQPRGGKFR